jgi:hypothetical protein
VKRMFTVLTAVAFGAAVLSPVFAQAQVAPAPSKDTANPSVAPKPDDPNTRTTRAHPSKGQNTASSVAPAPSKDTANSSNKPGKKAKVKKSTSSVSPAPSKDTANPSAKVTPKADEGTGANPSQKKAP